MRLNSRFYCFDKSILSLSLNRQYELKLKKSVFLDFFLQIFFAGFFTYGVRLTVGEEFPPSVPGRPFIFAAIPSLSFFGGVSY